MKYRPHKGGFDESMELTIEVNTLEELRKEIEKDYGKFDEITIGYYCYDPRNMWETYIVTIQVGDQFWPVGYTDGDFKDTPENRGV